MPWKYQGKQGTEQMSEADEIIFPDEIANIAKFENNILKYSDYRKKAVDEKNAIELSIAIQVEQIADVAISKGDKALSNAMKRQAFVEQKKEKCPKLQDLIARISECDYAIASDRILRDQAERMFKWKLAMANQGVKV
jgi:ferritin